jgi:hypothetical protein
LQGRVRLLSLLTSLLLLVVGVVGLIWVAVVALVDTENYPHNLYRLELRLL